MSKTICIWLVGFCLLGLAIAVAPKRDRNVRPYKLVCYWGTWSVYRPDQGKFQVGDIDENLCTHLIYTFVGLGHDNRIKVLDGYLDLEENWGKGNFKQFNALKKKAPGLTTLLAIGGWNEGSKKYSDMANDPARRKVFVQSCVEMLLKHDFDGLDMDWEYPANRQGIESDKEAFIELLKELRTAFDEHGFLLTAAVSAGKATIDTAYDVAQVSEILDFVNVMAYDFHGGWEKFTGHNAPLYARPDEDASQKILNVNFSMNYWMQLGAKPEKLVLGMGTYGRAFSLKSEAENGLGADAPGPGQAGPFTREPGMLGYNEICTLLKQGWTSKWDDWHQAPYAFKGNQWVGYDDERSIALKTDYAKKMKFAGVMIWSIETDDFRGTCGTKYALLNKITEVLDGGEVIRPTFPPTTPKPTGVTGDDESVTTKRPGKKECRQSGFFRDPQDCTKYFECNPAGEGKFDMINYSCWEGSAFDEQIKRCVDKKNVPDCH